MLNGKYLEWVDKANSQLVLKPVSKEEAPFVKDVPSRHYLGFLEAVIKKTISYKEDLDARERALKDSKRKSRKNSSIISHLKNAKGVKNSVSTRLKKTGLDSTTMDTTFPSIFRAKNTVQVKFFPQYFFRV